MPMVQQLNPIVHVNGQELQDDHLQWLIEIRIETEMRLPGKVVLRFRDPDNNFVSSGKFKVGGKISVKAKSGSETVMLIDATITGLGYETTVAYDAMERFDGRTGSIDEFFVVAHDNAFQLTRNCTVKGVEQVTPRDIVTALASAAGLDPTITLDSDAVIPVMSRLHSDYDLLNAIADREGVDWWVVASNKLHFGKFESTGGPTVTLGENLTSFSVKGSGLAPSTVSVRGYDADRKQDLAKTSQASSSQLWPKDVDLLNGLSGSPLHPTNATIVDARVMPSTISESTKIADGIRDRLVAGSTNARGESSGNPAIVIGKPVTVKGAGPGSGTYNVTKVEHVVRRDRFSTKFWAGDRTPTSIVDSLSNRTAPSLPVRHSGLVIGIVTNLGSGENAGQVRVKYPGLDADLVSAWGRFVAPSAGPNGRGWVMLPEVGDEVLVGFEDSDMHRPVVLGGVYSSDARKSAWPVQGDKITDRRYTSLNGHVMMIQDGDSDPDNMFKVTVKGKKGDVVLRMGGDKAEVTTPDDVPLELTCGGQSSIKFDGKGNIAIKGLKVTVEAQMGIEFKSDTTLDVKAGTALSLQSQAQAELKGAMVNVTAQGPLAAKGAIVQIN